MTSNSAICSPHSATPMCSRKSPAAGCSIASARRKYTRSAFSPGRCSHSCRDLPERFTRPRRLVLFFALRLLLGLAEAPAFPGNSRIVAAWFPAAERGGAAAVFNSSQYFSLFLFLPLSGWIAHQIRLALGILRYRRHGYHRGRGVDESQSTAPPAHPRVSAAELDFIESGGALVNMEKPSTTKTTAVAGPSQWTARQTITR